MFGSTVSRARDFVCASRPIFSRLSAPKPLRRIGGFALVATLVGSMLTVSAPSASFALDGPTPRPASTIQGTEAFLAGKYVQVGVRANGAFGSGSSVPANFQKQDSKGLGFVALRDKTVATWKEARDAGAAAGKFDGDFFVPGSPYEGWALQVGNNTAHNTDGPTGIPGAVSNLTTSGNAQTVTWSSTNSYQGLTVTKTYSVPEDDQQLNVVATITNSSGSSISGIYYGRGVDPDNGFSGEFSSTNTVSDQVTLGDGFSLVTAAFNNGAQISLFSTDPRSKVARESSGFDQTFIPKNVWDGAGSFRTGKGSTTADAGMNLIFEIGTLSAGSSTTVTYSYLLSSDAVQAATGSQTITFNDPAPATYGDTPRQVSASSSAGLPVTVASLDTGVCTVSGSSPDFTITFVSAGTCQLQATQSGSDTIDPATPVTRSFAVNPKTLTVAGITLEKEYDGLAAVDIEGTPEISGVIGGDDVSLGGTLTASFTSPGAGAGKAATFAGVTLEGDAATNYFLNLNTTGTISPRPLTAEISGVPERPFDNTNTIDLTGDDFALINTVDGDNVVVADITGELDDIEVGDRTVTVSGMTLTGSAASNYLLPVGDIVGPARIVRAEQEQLVTVVPSEIPFQGSTILTTTGGTGDGSTTYAVVDGGDACVINGSVLTVTGNHTDTCDVVATKQQDSRYLEASSDAVTITIVPSVQTPLALDGDVVVQHRTPLTLPIIGGSGDGVVSADAQSLDCTISGTPLTLVSSQDSGTSCTFTLSKAESTDGNWLAFTTDAISLVVAPGPTTIAPLTNVSQVQGSTPLALPTIIVRAGDQTVVAGNIAWVSSNPTSVQISGTSISFVRAGSAVVTATFTPDDVLNFLPVTASLTVTVIAPQPRRTTTVIVPDVIPPTTGILTIPPTAPTAPPVTPPAPTSGPVLPGGTVPQPGQPTSSFVGGLPAPTQVGTLGTTGVRVTTGQIDLGIRVPTPTSGQVTTGPDGSPELTVIKGQQTLISGTGVAPGSIVQAFLPLNGSNAIELGRIQADATGTFNGQAVLNTPLTQAPLPVGRHVLQILGVDADGNQTVVNMTINIAQPPPQPEINRENQEVPTLAVGQSLATEAGIPVAVTVTPVPENKQTLIEGDGWTMGVSVDGEGAEVEETADGEVVLKLVRDETASVSGSGFMPLTRADVWLFSEPTLLGTVDIDENGEFNGVVNVDGTVVTVGEHTLQLQGVGQDGYVRAANLGVLVGENPDLVPTTTATSSLTWLLWAIALFAVAAIIALFWWLRRQGLNDETTE